MPCLLWTNVPFTGLFIQQRARKASKYGLQYDATSSYAWKVQFSFLSEIFFHLVPTGLNTDKMKIGDGVYKKGRNKHYCFQDKKTQNKICVLMKILAYLHTGFWNHLQLQDQKPA